MTFGTSASTRRVPPRTAWFSALSKADMAWALVLMSGVVLLTVAVIGLLLQQHFNTHWQRVPYAIAGLALIWCAAGVCLLYRKPQHVQDGPQPLDQHVPQHHIPAAVPAPVPDVSTLQSDEPWELRAFWSQSMAASHYAVPSREHQGDFAAQPDEDGAMQVIATIEGDRPLRPISLFGSVQ